MKIENTEVIRSDVLFAFWKTLFDEKFSDPVTAFSTFFSGINAVTVVGVIRDGAYVSKIKEILASHPEYQDYLELEKGVIETMNSRIMVYNSLVEQAEEVKASIDSMRKYGK